MKKYGLIISFFLLYVRLVSQDEVSHKFGKINVSTFSLKYCPIDSNAVAYYIFDDGSSYPKAGYPWRMNYRHYRIHILDKSARSIGNISIPLYHEGPKAKEELSDFKASTFYLTKGKIVERKLDKKLLRFTTSADPSDQVDFTMPAVIPGSIIEIEYTIRSDFWDNITQWEFQHDLPVSESNYTTVAPDYIQFKPHFWGNQKIDHLTSQRWDQESQSNTTVSLYHITNVPAFPNEPYILNKKDYQLRVEFELISILSDEGRKGFAYSWEDLNKQLLNDEAFGKQLNNNTYLLQVANSITSSVRLPIDKMKAAYQYIHRRMRWNHDFGIYPSENIQNAWETRTGNVADINLTLLKLLRTLDISCAPVLLSTVKHGKILPDFSSLSKLNYLIVAIPQEEKTILLDAADPFASFDLIPPRCFNGPGLMLINGGATWIDIKPIRLGQNQAEYKLRLNAEYIWEGLYKERAIQYSAYKLRDELKDSTQLIPYIDYLNDRYTDIRLSEPTFLEFSNEDKDVILQANIKSRMGLTRSKDSITFSPIQMERFLNNPFKSTFRSMPVEYDFPWMTNSIVEFSIPSGYSVTHLPSSVTYQNAEKSIKFTYVIQSLNDSSLVAKSLLIVNQFRFSEVEYPNLQVLFDHIVNKQAEVVVFKKND
ncbi:MAG: DUF3857 domain-containing protein [Saprospiraceae bacterium]